MGKSITSLLHIQGWWKVEEIQENRKEIHLYLANLRRTANCPKCSKRTKTGYDRRKERRILHTTIGKQLVFLHLAPRRFICGCNPDHPFIEQIPGITGKRRTTERFDDELLNHLVGQAFSTVTSKLSLSYPSQRDRLTKSIDPHKLRWETLEELPEIHLGFDEHHLVNRRFVETVAEVKQGIPLGILPNNKQATIAGALLSCPNHLCQKIKSITLDMDDKTIMAARRILHNVIIVIDHYHVIQDANRRLNEARLIEQEEVNRIRTKKELGKIEIPHQQLRKAKEHLSPQETLMLSALFNRYPRLKVWYEHKERLRDVYKSKDRKEAEGKLNFLIGIMLVTDDVDLCLWGKSLKYYREEILNYFVYRTTNAYTEGLHVRCKLVQRISSGFRNAEVYIRKAMLFLIPLSVLLPAGVYPHYLS